MNNVLEVRGLNVSFDGFKAIDDLNIGVPEKGLNAIIGPNGAGKTTFMDLITGKTKPDSGEILWGPNHISLLKLSESKIAQLGIGRKFQKPTVFEKQSVYDNLLMALKNRRSVISNLGYKKNFVDQKIIEKTSKIINLEKSISRVASELSHGQKQWLEIGMLLAQDPKVLLVDEPAAGMTIDERKKTVELLKSISIKKSVIVVEHDMEFVKSLNCNVIVLNEGSVLAEGNMEHVSQNEKVIDVYLGR